MPGRQRTSGGRVDEEAYEAEYEEAYDEPDEERRRARAPTKERRDERGTREAVSLEEVARIAAREITELTGKQPLGITALERADDGWLVEIEVVEDSRIPSSTDLLGLYRIGIGVDGSLTTVRRIRRYSRGKGNDSEGA